jgi:hypothetical protein
MFAYYPFFQWSLLATVFADYRFNQLKEDFESRIDENEKQREKDLNNFYKEHGMRFKQKNTWFDRIKYWY